MVLGRHFCEALRVLWVTTAIATVSFVFGLGLVLVGPWPPRGFIGLDVFLSYMALKISYRRAQTYEIVQLPLDLVLVKR